MAMSKQKAHLLSLYHALFRFKLVVSEKKSFIHFFIGSFVRSASCYGGHLGFSINNKKLEILIRNIPRKIPTNLAFK